MHVLKKTCRIPHPFQYVKGTYVKYNWALKWVTYYDLERTKRVKKPVFVCFCLPLRAQRQSPILSVSSFAVRDSTDRQVRQATVPLGHHASTGGSSEEQMFLLFFYFFPRKRRKWKYLSKCTSPCVNLWRQFSVIKYTQQSIKHTHTHTNNTAQCSRGWEKLKFCRK